MLKADGIGVAYGQSQIIESISFDLQEGESVAILGRNGMGKTTLLKSLIGLLPIRRGRILYKDLELTKLAPYQRVKAGLAYVPQGRMIFPRLTVTENILTGMTHTGEKSVPDYIYRYFPVLKDMADRRGGNLSGGQQQMLAIARALVSNPGVLILDEPTEGIQPSIIRELGEILNDLRRERGFAVIVSEQVLSFALAVAQRLLVIERGEIVLESQNENLDRKEVERYLTV